MKRLFFILIIEEPTSYIYTLMWMNLILQLRQDIPMIVTARAIP
ncbi:MAG: hypothetical protein ABJB16_11970 [Saprospiraceae bacterium]